MAKKKNCADKNFTKKADAPATISSKTKDKPFLAKVLFWVYNWYPKDDFVYVSENELKQTSQLLFIK